MAGTQTIVRFTSERNYTATAVRLDGDPVPLLRPREIKAGVEYVVVMCISDGGTTAFIADADEVPALLEGGA